MPFEFLLEYFKSKQAENIVMLLLFSDNNYNKYLIRQTANN